MKSGIIKMFRDLRLYKGRTVLTLAGILIGLISVGAVLAAYATLNREMDANFMSTNPNSFVLEVQDLDQPAIELLKEVYPGSDIELRKTVQARISRGDGTYGTILLRAVQDFDQLKVDTFTLEEGKMPTTPSELVLERDCLKLLKNLKTGVNESVTIKLPGGLEKEMLLGGRVHAPGLPPASMENYSYAFLSLEGLKNLGDQGWYNELCMVSYDNRFDLETMKKLSRDVKKLLSEHGYHVTRVSVPKPGKHPHADQLDSLLFLLQAFAMISLIAACLIIINLLNFIMSKQRSQIAVMKAVGASTFDIAVPYFIYVFLISLVGIILSIPLAIQLSKVYCLFAASILNFNIINASIPLWVFVIQVAVGILIPFGSAAYPIFKSCKVSVKEGLSEKVGNFSSSKGKGHFFKKVLFSKNSKIIIPINNLFRKRTRTTLAICALAAGGILFMTSRNIVASIDQTVDKTFEAFRWSYDIRVAGNYPQDQLKHILSDIEGIDQSEIWRANKIILTKRDGTDSVSYQVRIIPEHSQMAKIDISQGLDDKQEKSRIVITNGLLEDEKWLKVGMTIQAKINGKVAEVVISGVVNEVPPVPAVYMESETFERLFGGPTQQVIYASTKTADENKQRAILKEIEAKFKAGGVELSDNWNISVLRKAFVDHLFVIITFLSTMAMLAILVGGLSIGSAIGMNVAERKREMGIQRAVGVKRAQLISMVLFEVVMMGLVGWFIGVVLSFPVSIWVGNYFGQIFLHTNLENTLSLSGAVQWLIISLSISVLAGLIPAWQTASASLREMLSYE